MGIRTTMRRLVSNHTKESDEYLGHFFLEERYRRSVGITGFLISGAGAGAISCWLTVAGLYLAHPPEIVLRLLIVASAILLAGVVIGFLAALTGYKAFESAAALGADQYNEMLNQADDWVARTNVLRSVAAILVTIGGGTAFTAFIELAWR
jgi:fructose-1-phosphate kinase PfkB-like protein